MLKYIISCCFIFVTSIVTSQETGKLEETPEENSKILKEEIIAKNETLKDSTAYEKNYGLRVGIDVVKPILSIVKDNYTGFEIVGDYRIKRNFYVAAEIGIADQDTRRDTYEFTTKGTYISAGINYNFFKNWLEMDNEIYVGLRYGFSAFSQTLNRYFLYQEGTTIEGVPGAYFEPKRVEEPIHYDGLTAHWAALVFGIKVETFKNLYLGASAQFNTMLSSVEPHNFENLFVPGFNKVYSTNTGVGFNYTISYRIPLYKK